MTDPDVPRHRSHKDRRRWCGGHPGREHVLEIALPTSPYRRCSWVAHYPHPYGQRLGQVLAVCVHVLRCTVCRKHVEPLNPRDCPVLAETPKPTPTLHPMHTS